MVYSKRIAIIAVEKTKQPENRPGLHFVTTFLSANHSFLSVKFLLNRSNCAKRIGKS